MVEVKFANLRIVLVEPAGARNVGAIARVMKNMGFSRLVLVNPQCDYRGDEARQMAVHAADLLETAQQVATLPEALVGCERAIATTARTRALETQLQTPRTGLSWLLGESTTPGTAPPHTALIFGPEDRGLSNQELKYAQRFVRIPSSPAYPSLNLAQAVGICCYELSQSLSSMSEGETSEEAAQPQPSVPPTSAPQEQAIAPPARSLQPPSEPFAPLELLEAYYQHLEQLLLKIGYLYPHTVTSRMEKFRRLFNRTYPSTSEVAMLRGVLSQVDWALSVSGFTPKSSTSTAQPDHPPASSADEPTLD